MLSVLLFATESLIALFVHDSFIRPFIGDMLVVILLFAVCRTFLKVDHFRLALGVLVFSFLIEVGQYFELVKKLGLQRNRLARTIIGATFDFHDLLAYLAGVLLILIVDFSAKRGVASGS